jgi:hypothetical protein
MCHTLVTATRPVPCEEKLDTFIREGRPHPKPRTLALGSGLPDQSGPQAHIGRFPDLNSGGAD